MTRCSSIDVLPVMVFEMRIVSLTLVIWLPAGIFDARSNASSARRMEKLLVAPAKRWTPAPFAIEPSAVW